MHVLLPSLMDELDTPVGGSRGERLPRRAGEGDALHCAGASWRPREQYLAVEQHNSRYDLGVHYGLFNAQLALALQGQDRDEVLAQIVELLAQRDLLRRENEQPMSELVHIITATDPEVRNRSLDAWCRTATKAQLLAECAALDAFRRSSDNLYERVRALFFLYAIYRFHLPLHPTSAHTLIPFEGLQQPASAPL